MRDKVSTAVRVKTSATVKTPAPDMDARDRLVMSAAAALVAEVAANERAVTMSHADCDSYRWVRVQAPQRVSDVLVTAAQEERGCQAELIAH